MQQSTLARTRNDGNRTRWTLDAASGFSVSANQGKPDPHRHSGHCQAGLRLIVVTRGQIDLRFDRQSHALRASDDRPQILMVNLNEATRFERECSGQTREDKICMTLDQGWLEQHGLDAAGSAGALRALLRGHLAARQWTGCPRVAALARRMLESRHSECPWLGQLAREGQALGLLTQLFGEFGDSAQHDRPASPRLQRQLNKVKTLLDSGEADHWTMQQMADYACMSSSTLQRHFRRHLGCSVFEYLRRQRLARAMQQLRQGERSITDIAFDAGYHSPANFATAFRKAFGITPRECVGCADLASSAVPT